MGGCVVVLYYSIISSCFLYYSYGGGVRVDCEVILTCLFLISLSLSLCGVELSNALCPIYQSITTLTHSLNPVPKPTLHRHHNIRTQENKEAAKGPVDLHKAVPTCHFNHTPSNSKIK